MGYLDAQVGDGARSAFRRAEKHYKFYKHLATSKRKSVKQSRGEVPATDLSRVLDFREVALGQENDAARECGIERLQGEFGTPVYVLKSHPGFYFLPGAVPHQQQFDLIKDALTTFPEPPNRTSHTAHYGPISGLWSAVNSRSYLVQDAPADILAEFTNSLAEVVLGHPKETPPSGADDSCSTVETLQPRVHRSGGGRDELFVRKWKFVSHVEDEDQKAVPAEHLLRKLRWATLGIQFDWSKRAYDISLPYRKFPKPLAELATKLAEPAMDGGTFHAEAAIVNFFGPDDMLGGHIDDMEADWSKPIVSISLGCKAIFLLGGESREDAPVAMYLRSGDAVLMKGPARRCFHGVPRIFSSKSDSEVPSFACDGTDDQPIWDYIQESRININIREVF